MNITNIIHKMYLLDFYERKFDTIVGASATDLDKLNKQHEICTRNRFYSYEPLYSQETKPIEEVLQNKYPLLYDILLLGDGKLSICGICIIDLIKDKALIRSKQFHLYVHSCNLDVANTLILKCIELLGNNLLVTKDYIDVFGKYFMCRIFLTVFKDRDQILKNIGGPPEQHGYDPVAKYFSTMNGVLSLSARAYPLCFPIDQKKLITYISRFIYPILLWKNPKNTICRGPSIEIFDCSFKHNFYMLQTVNITYDMIDENFVEDCKLTLDEVQQLTKVHNNTLIPHIHPNVYYKDYVPMTIGISNDRYVAFSYIRELFNITDDLFQLLCRYWFELEVGVNNY